MRTIVRTRSRHPLRRQLIVHGLSIFINPIHDDLSCVRTNFYMKLESWILYSQRRRYCQLQQRQGSSPAFILQPRLTDVTGYAAIKYTCCDKYEYR